MSKEPAQTVILYRQGDQDYITFGNGQPIEVKIVESLPLEIEGQAQQISPPGLGATTQYIVVPSQEKYEDSIHYAAQLGRLDIVSLILGMFGIILALAAFFGFWMIRRAAIDAAEREARQETRQLLPNMVPIEVRKSVELMMRNTTQDDESEVEDPYATAQENENDAGA